MPQERVAKLRAAVAQEKTLVAGLLARVSDPGLKARITLLRRDLEEFEPVFLKPVESSYTPELLLSAGERWSAGLVREREAYDSLVAQYGPGATLIG